MISREEIEFDIGGTPSKSSDMDWFRKLHNKVTPSVNYWHKRGRFPLGTINAYNTYTVEELKKAKNWLWQKINKKEPYSAVVITFSRSQKTVLTKRMIENYHAAGYRIWIIDSKANEWHLSSSPGKTLSNDVGFGRRLHPDEVPQALPMHLGVPRYAYDLMPTIANVTEEMNVYCADARAMTTEHHWMTLGLSEKAAVPLATAAKNSTDNRHFLIKAERLQNMHPGTKDAIDRELSALKEYSFFGKKDEKTGELFDNPLLVPHYWERGIIPISSYFEKKKRYMALDIGMQIEAIKAYAEAEYQSTGKITPTIIVCDDAYLYADASRGTSLAVHEITKTLVNYGMYSIGAIVIIQDPQMLSESIISNVQDFYFSKIGSVQALNKYTLSKEIKNLIEDLYFDKINYNYEYVRVKQDRFSYDTFYPGGTKSGHTY